MYTVNATEQGKYTHTKHSFSEVMYYELVKVAESIFKPHCPMMTTEKLEP
jgi:hypothetical protein